MRIALALDAPGGRPGGDPGVYDQIGVSIAGGAGWSLQVVHPRAGRTTYRPTALHPPAWPALLGATYALTDHDQPIDEASALRSAPDVGARHAARSSAGARWTAGRVVNALLGAAAVGLIALIAMELWGPPVALVAGLVAALYPSLAILGVALLSEPLFIVLELAAIYAVLRRRRAGGSGSWRWLVLAGVLCGLAILTRANGAVLLLPLALAAWTERPRRRPRALLAPAVLVVAAALTVLPWTLRNASVLHAAVPVASDLGPTLAGTYNPASAAAHFGWRAARHLPPGYAPPRALSEAQRSSALARDGLRYISAHPLALVEASAWNTLRLVDGDRESPGGAGARGALAHARPREHRGLRPHRAARVRRPVRPPGARGAAVALAGPGPAVGEHRAVRGQLRPLPRAAGPVPDPARGAGDHRRGRARGPVADGRAGRFRLDRLGALERGARDQPQLLRAREPLDAALEAARLAAGGSAPRPRRARPAAGWPCSGSRCRAGGRRAGARDRSTTRSTASRRGSAAGTRSCPRGASPPAWRLSSTRMPIDLDPTAPSAPVADRAGALLHELAGPDARFREHQLEAVRDLVEDRARVLCVQRTGWGKSAVYFLATALLRERGAGPALIVSPLLALMRNQIAAAERLGIRAHTINSTNRDEWDEVARAARRRRGRPAADQPRAAQQPALPRRAAAAVRRARRARRRRRGALHLRLGPRLPAGLPAHRRACSRGLPDGRRRARHDRDGQRPRGRRRRGAARRRRARCKTYRGPLGRSSLRFEVVELPGPGRPAGLAGDVAAAAAGLRDRLHAHQARRRGRRRVADRAAGIPAEAYSGEIETERRIARRGPAAAQRAQGGRGHERARHGLRQARPRLRRPLPGAGLGRSPTTSRSAARAAASSAPRSCCCAAPRTAASRTSSSSRRSRAASVVERVLDAPATRGRRRRDDAAS